MATAEGDWQCENKGCGFTNKSSAYRCLKCDVIRPYIPSTVGQPCTEDSLTYPASLGATSLQYNVTSIKSSPDHARQRGLGVGAPLREEEITFPEQECRMVLLGKTGNGKSSTGNTIVNVAHFAVGRGMASATKKCQRYNTNRFGINIEVVDTPGFFDTDDDDEVIKKEVMKCVGIVSPGPHAVLLLVRLNERFTEEEARSVQEVRNLFGNAIMRHVIVVFTFGDQLEQGVDEATALREYLRDCPKALEKLLKDVDNRYVVFNNKGSAAVKYNQVRQLLLTIRGMLSGTGDQPFTSTFLEQCAKAVTLNATQLGDLLDSKTVTNQHLRNLVRAGLEGRDTLESILHEVLEQQDKERKRAERAEKEATILKKALGQQDKERKRAEKAEKEATILKKALGQQDKERKRAEKAEKEAHILKEALDKSQRLQRQLEENLQKERTKWTCHLL